jgi:hypothetical protein
LPRYVSRVDREHVSPLRWLAFVLLIVIAAPVFATVAFFAGQKVGAVGFLVAAVALSGPFARFITLPIRQKEPRVSRAQRLRRFRFWGLLDGALLLAGAIVLGSALAGRAVAGDWGIVVGVCLGYGVVWAGIGTFRRRFTGAAG